MALEKKTQKNDSKTAPISLRLTSEELRQLTALREALAYTSFGNLVGDLVKQEYELQLRKLPELSKFKLAKKK